MTHLLDIVIYALLPVAAIIIGGIAGLLRKPSGAFISAVLHFAAGVVFSVVAVELLPDIIKGHKPLEVGIGFGLGIGTMLLIKHFVEKMENKESATEIKGGLPIGLLVAMGIDLLIDGLLLGVGFAAGNKEGILLSVALALEVFSLGLAVTLACSKSKITNKQILFVLVILAVTFFVGSIIGITMLAGLSQEVLELVLSFGLAALLFLVTEELLTEGTKKKSHPGKRPVSLPGFLFF